MSSSPHPPPPEVVVKNRFLGFLIWQSITSTLIFIIFKIFILSPLTPSFLFSLFAFLIFHLSQLFFSASLSLLSSPQPSSPASPFRLASAFLLFLFVSGDSFSSLDFRRGASLSLKFLLFGLATSVSGFLSVICVCGWDNGSCDGFRGFVSGLLYALFYIYRRRWILEFPIIQRPPFFSFKMKLPSAIRQAFKLSTIAYLFSAVLLVFLPNNFKSYATIRKFIAEQILLYCGNFSVFLCWEVSHDLHQACHCLHVGVACLFFNFLGVQRVSFIAIVEWVPVLTSIFSFKYLNTSGLPPEELALEAVLLNDEEQANELDKDVLNTKRFIFAPPKGSAAAETNPSEPLLAALEESNPGSLPQHLAYLDLCMACENNVDTWRRAAFFEETGETYKRVVAVCLRPLEQLASTLGEGFETNLVEKAYQPSYQLQSQTELQLDSKYYEPLNNFQQCAWCARIVAILTARSHKEDRFGVAQLSGSNAAVVSTLMSCLLAVEAFMGKKTNLQNPHQLMGPAGIKWATPNMGRRDIVVAKKRSGPLYFKAYAMADVLRTSIYCIASAFHDEMLASDKAGLLEKDWLITGKPLFGTRELLLQKLHHFLDFRAS